MQSTAFVRRATVFALSLFVSVAAAQQTQFSHGDPTPLEQQMLELVNRARMNPAQEGGILNAVNTWYSVDARARKPSFFANLIGEFSAYPAAAPVAFNAKLIAAARAHSQDMVARNFFAHVNPSGQDPTARAAAAGYDVGVGENIDGGGASAGDDILMSHFAFMVDYDNLDTSNPIGHRLNALDSSYSEIGIGTYGPRSGGKITQDFGGPARSYILGVAYSDTNANSAYDAGEGTAGITVRPDVGNWFAVTSTSGGFAIPVDPVQTVSDTVNVPFAVQTSTWAAVQPFDASYRQQQLAAAPTMTVNLTWSGGPLAAPRTSTVTMKRPVLRNYRIVGTDGWYYSMSMVTTQNAKADLPTASTVPPPPRTSVPTKDLNNDGNADILCQNSIGQIVAWHMNGAGARSNWAWISTGPLGDWKIVGTADFNNDGNADILCQNAAGQIIVWYMNGADARSSWAWLSTGPLGDWKVVGTADFNNDGNTDILLQNAYGQIIVWYMNGTGGRTGWSWISTGPLGDWKVVGTADFNNDGNTDILCQNSIGQIIVWYMNGAGVRSSWAWLSTGPLGDWKVVGTADYNNDGNTDILCQNAAGQILVWYMNGAGARSSWAWISTGPLGDWRVR